jgi:molybdate transport system substrate-binding protein
MRFTSFFSGLFLLLTGHLAFAATLSVATASNFSDTLKRIAPAFEKATGHHLRISAASSGKLYAQIRHGAPYDLFLSADAARPIALEQEGLSLPGSRFTYAVGQLALWAPDPANHGLAQKRLENHQFRRLAIGNPKTAPYGIAAMETLKQLGLWDALVNDAARGENIGQTFQFVATGNADIGFVALSQLIQAKIDPAQYWVIPAQHHQPILQQGIILKRSANKKAAERFFDFIKGPAAEQILRESGYLLEAAKE